MTDNRFLKEYEKIICSTIIAVAIIVLAIAILVAANILANKIYEGFITFPYGFPS